MKYSNEDMAMFFNLARLIASDEEKNLTLALQIQRGVMNPILDKLFQDISRAVVINDTMRGVGVDETNVYDAVRSNEHTMLQYCLRSENCHLPFGYMLYTFLPDNIIYLLSKDISVMRVMRKIESYELENFSKELKLDIKTVIGNNNFTEKQGSSYSTHLPPSINVSSTITENAVITSFDARYIDKKRISEIFYFNYIRTDIFFFDSNKKVNMSSYLQILNEDKAKYFTVFEENNLLLNYSYNLCNS